MRNSLLLPLPPNCLTATFLRRIKRFSVELEHGGETVMAHTNNTGAMLGVPGKGAMALLSPAAGMRRKLPYTLERIKSPEKGLKGVRESFWIGVNTQTPNRLLKAAFLAGLLPFARDYASLKMEAKRGQSRLDACFSGTGLPDLWVECKNVSLVEDCVASFPDAASARGRKHLRELMDIVVQGARAAMFYVVQRPDARCFAPADYVDPEYAELFYEARHAGVEIYPFEAVQTPEGIALGSQLPVRPKVW